MWTTTKFGKSDLTTGSVDRTVKVINTGGTVIWNSGHQHRDAVNAVKIFTDSKGQMLIASGDDEGRVMVRGTSA